MLAAVTTALMVATPAVAQVPYQPRPLPAPGEGVCPGGLCGASSLSSLFRALADSETGRRRTPVRILQIGDSHTAGDRIPGALRSRLQGRFGRAGRGALPPVANAPTLLVQVQGDGWITDQPPLQASGRPGASVGLSGRLARGAVGAWIELNAEPGAEMGVIGVCARAATGPARIAVTAGALPRALDFDRPAPACRSVTLDHGATSARLSVSLGELTLDSLWVEQTGGGVTVSPLGIVGAALTDLAARDEGVVAAELAAFQPDLIILAFGTNEGFDDALDPAAYEALLRGQVARLRRLAPGAALLILGAPDALRRGAPFGCAAAPERGPPPSLAVVRDVQRRVADDLGVAFWDWHGRMGGDCAAERLAIAETPLMRPDRVHFAAEGADWIGGVLGDDILAAYDAWKGSAR